MRKTFLYTEASRPEMYGLAKAPEDVVAKLVKGETVDPGGIVYVGSPSRLVPEEEDAGKLSPVPTPEQWSGVAERLAGELNAAFVPQLGISSRTVREAKSHAKAKAKAKTASK